MALPVTICDDSSFARKQIARALPAGWDVDVAYAANGREGLERVRAGQADVLFLDLTMPEMDGFEVLEAVRREDLPTLVIVVSGDIQPEAMERVQRLGAVAFLKKPVDAERLQAVLDDFGLLNLTGGAAVAEEGEVDFRDWCQEIANVAMGRAADLLAQVLGAQVLLSVPKVRLLEPAELAMTLASSDGENGFSSVSQGFIGGGVAGETLLVFSETDMEEIARLLHYSAGGDASNEIELLMEIANVLIGAFLKGIADQLDIQFSHGQPMIHLSGDANRGVFRSGAEPPGQLLTIELTYSIGSNRITCDQLLLFTETARLTLEQRAGYVLGAA